MDRRKRAWWTDEEPTYAAEPRTMVIEEEASTNWTGLYDSRGEPICRDRAPFGFRRT